MARMEMDYNMDKLWKRGARDSLTDFILFGFETVSFFLHKKTKGKEK